MGYSRNGGVDCQSCRVSFVSTSKRSRKGRLPSGDAPPPVHQNGLQNEILFSNVYAAPLDGLKGQRVLLKLPGVLHAYIAQTPDLQSDLGQILPSARPQQALLCTRMPHSKQGML